MCAFFCALSVAICTIVPSNEWRVCRVLGRERGMRSTRSIQRPISIDLSIRLSTYTHACTRCVHLRRTSVRDTLRVKTQILQGTPTLNEMEKSSSLSRNGSCRSRLSNASSSPPPRSLSIPCRARLGAAGGVQHAIVTEHKSASINGIICKS